MKENTMKAKISPSILSADFARLADDVSNVCRCGIDYLHIDVMDGAFVPNISFGAGVMKSLNSVAAEYLVPYDIHLMVEEPGRYVEDFVTEHSEFITVHYEACSDLSATIKQIKGLKEGMKAGVSIKPATDPSVLNEYLEDIDLILVMSVEPGFGGQKFMDSSLPKIKYLKERRDALGLSYVIEVDGGISSANAHLVKEAGVDIIVAGSAVFKAEDRQKEIDAITGR